MQANSSPVQSNQPHTHPALPALVHRHLTNRWRKPVASHNQEAFDRLQDRLLNERRPLIMDSFCGTGHSTTQLAQRYPDHLVVGVDKSAQRLSRHEGPGQDYLLLRAECEPLWLLMAHAGITLEQHFLLYPNPWPKSIHLKRRIHGHPAFPVLLALGGKLELRSNWQLYVEEFGLALHLAGGRGRVRALPPASPLTLFEQKYHDSGHQLWQYQGQAPNRPK